MKGLNAFPLEFILGKSETNSTVEEVFPPLQTISWRTKFLGGNSLSLISVDSNPIGV